MLMYYYAHIDESSIVIEVCALNEPIFDSMYIEIAEAQYNNGKNLVGLRYDPDYHTLGGYFMTVYKSGLAAAVQTNTSTNYK